MYSNARYILAAMFTALIVGCGGGGSQSAPGNDSLVPGPPSASNSPYPRPGSTVSPGPGSTASPAPGTNGLPVTALAGGDAVLRIDPLITAHISREITGADFNEIYDTLAILPDEMRDDVVEFTNDGVYGTSRASIDDAKSFDKSSLDNLPNTDLSPESLNRQSAVSDVGGNCFPKAFALCTGQAYVATTAGYAYESSQVFVPCAASILDGRHVNIPDDHGNLKSKPKQTGYIYFGGFSSGHTSSVDIGLQLNPVDGSLASPFSVQTFTNVRHAQGAEINGTPAGGRSNPKVKCNELINMTYFISQTSQNDRTSRLILNVRDSSGSQTLATKVNASDGWYQTCTTCTMKRVTSLSVKGNLREQEPLNTWLGVGNPRSKAPSPLVAWRNAKVGSFAPAGLQAPSSVGPWRSAKITMDPEAGIARGIFLIDAVNASNETIGINLAAPKLQLKNPKK